MKVIQFGAISNSAQDFITTIVNTWMAEHPTMSWIVAHPLWSIALILLMLLLGWSLLGAIAQLAQQACLSILKAPLKLTHLLSKGSFQFLNRADTLQPVRLNVQQDAQKRLPEILDRLELLRQEQEALIKEMRSIVISKP